MLDRFMSSEEEQTRMRELLPTLLDQSPWIIVLLGSWQTSGIAEFARALTIASNIKSVLDGGCLERIQHISDANVKNWRAAYLCLLDDDDDAVAHGFMPPDDSDWASRIDIFHIDVDYEPSESDQLELAAFLEPRRLHRRML